MPSRFAQVLGITDTAQRRKAGRGATPVPRVVLYDPLATMGVRVGQDIAVVVERLA